MLSISKQIQSINQSIKNIGLSSLRATALLNLCVPCIYFFNKQHIGYKAEEEMEKLKHYDRGSTFFLFKSTEQTTPHTGHNLAPSHAHRNSLSRALYPLHGHFE